MKSLTTIMILAFVLFGCKADTKKEPSSADTLTKKQQVVPCDNFDSLLLKHADNFKPAAINLNQSVSKELDTFLSKIDTTCLRQQKDYSVFISVVLSKLYYHHLTCCNQGYDLLTMREGAATIIINEFERIAGYQNQNLEMLNSGTIVDFIESNSQLKSNAALKVIVDKIKVEQKRIIKGV